MYGLVLMVILYGVLYGLVHMVLLFDVLYGVILCFTPHTGQVLMVLLTVALSLTPSLLFSDEDVLTSEICVYLKEQKEYKKRRDINKHDTIKTSSYRQTHVWK